MTGFDCFSPHFHFMACEGKLHTSKICSGHNAESDFLLELHWHFKQPSFCHSHGCTYLFLFLLHFTAAQNTAL